MKSNILQFLLATIGLSLALGCANIVPPSGGARDNVAPKLIQASPPDKTLNFTANQINLQFNEFISLKDVANKLLVSPPMVKKPTVKSNGKKLTIEFNESLKDNTTYTLNFGNSIVDYTEGNAINNFTYIFSTGTVLDSASINGKVLLAKNGSIAKKANILLYKNEDDVSKQQPLYFSRTDDKGKFVLNNIKAGQYFVFALDDQNANYYYDLPNELIAFSDSPIVVTDTVNQTILLNIFKSSNNVQKVLDVIKRENGVLKIAFAMPEEEADVAAINTDKNIEFSRHFNSAKDTLTIYISEGYGQNIQMLVKTKENTLDTITWEATKQSPKGVETFVELNVSNKGLANTIDKNQVLKLSVNFPIGEIDESKIFFRQDTFDKKLYPTIKKVDSDLSAQLSFNFENNKKYFLTIEKDAITDIADRKNKKATHVFKIPSEENYSKLDVTFTEFTDNKQYLLELVGADNKVKSTTLVNSASQIVSFPELRSGNYKLRAIEDANKNGRWDTGNFKNRLQPERIITHTKIVKLKPGWENEVAFSLK